MSVGPWRQPRYHQNMSLHASVGTLREVNRTVWPISLIECEILESRLLSRVLHKVAVPEQ
eukprot:8496225-Pyramimonas_sp.AAC.1